MLTTVRRREGDRRWIDAYRSLDAGASWAYDSTPVGDAGIGNPPSLIRLRDGRLVLTYGYRAPPFGIRARVSVDGGQSWGDDFALRRDGGGRDVGYVRSVERADGNVVTVYYIHDEPSSERYIAATIWVP